MGLVLVTPPAQPIMSTADAKMQLRETISAQDPLIDMLVLAARDQAEAFLQRPLLNGGYRFTMDGFPGCHDETGYGRHWWRADRGTIYLPIGGVSSVSAITYVDSNGITQTLDPSLYQVSVSEPTARVAPAYQQAWPMVRPVMDAVAVGFIAGYGDSPDAVPPAIIQAVKLIVGNLFANREAVVVGATAIPLPLGAEHLLYPYRVWPLA